jgi:isoleucyl-tRNA synthetase
MVQNAARWQESEAGAKRVFRPDGALAAASSNPIDVWVLAELMDLVAFVHVEMKAYRLYTVMPRLVAFLDQLTKWYVRLNRERLKGSEGDGEALVGLSVLFKVLETVTSVMSPFTPFFAEFLYLKLRRLSPNFGDTTSSGHRAALGSAASVHFLQLPVVDASDGDAAAKLAAAKVVSLEMAALQTVVELGRKARENVSLSLKKPVTNIVIITSTAAQMSGLTKLAGYLKSELTAFNVTPTAEEDKWCTYSATPNFGALGKRCGKQMPDVKKGIGMLTHAEMGAFFKKGSVAICGFELTASDLTVTHACAPAWWSTQEETG